MSSLTTSAPARHPAVPEPLRRCALLLVRYWPIALITLAVVIAFGPDLADTAHIPYDLEYYHYPLLGTVEQMIAHGHLPIWDQDTYGGVPLLANAQSEWLYLPHLALYAILIILGKPLTVHQLSLMVIVHLWIAGVGTCMLARSRDYGNAAAAFAGGFIVCCGIVVEETQHLAYAETLAWIPWAVMLIDRMADRVTPRLVSGLAVLFFLIVAAGFLPMVIPAVVVLVGFAVFRESGHRRALAGTIGGLVLGALLAAAVLAPVAALSHYFPPELPYNTHRISSLTTTLYPDAFGFWKPVTQSATVQWLNGDYFYIGGMGLLMIPIALSGGRRAWLGATFTLLILLLSVGTIGEHFTRFVQGLSHAYGPLYRPALVLYCGAPQLALFLASGLRRVPTLRQISAAVGVLVIFAAVGIANAQGHELRLLSAAPTAELIAVFAGLVVLIAARWLPRRYAAVALAACAIGGVVELALAAHPRFWINYPGMGTAASQQGNLPPISTLRAELKPGQRLAIDALDLPAGFDSLPPLWDVSSTNGFQPQFSKYQLERVNQLGGAGSQSALALMNRTFPTTPRQLPYYREMNARYAIVAPTQTTFVHARGFTRVPMPAAPGVAVYKVSGPMSRAWLLDRSCLDRRGVGAIAACRDGDVPTALTSNRSRRLTVPDSGHARTVVASEPYYPGWSATGGGRSLHVSRLGFLTAIRVPAGVRTVDLTYSAKDLLPGVVISLLTLLGLIAVSIRNRVPLVDRFRRRAGRRPPPPAPAG